MKNWLEKQFRLSEFNTDIKTELLAGLTTFVTMAYVLATIPNILAGAGYDKHTTLTVMILLIIVTSCAMALFTNRPFALAPGLGSVGIIASMITNEGVTLSGKLLQMANGAVYSDEGDEIVIHDQKLDALEDMIEAANGRPVMVAYWFKHDLSRIMRRLSDKKIPFEKLDSEESIRKWNRGELQVALIHPASAGHGLNLQSGGNMLIWFGLTWSLELYQQTVARLWRQGQTSETVVVQHIITAGTIDEDVMKALASKDMTQNRLIAAVKARVTHGR